ncbi:helix-turn-helix domain-containing protein [Lacticaseibacillus paracasei]|uniref:helix-turn-helix domain-containing protein n=1 Tax=Lacticaseibacillus paracasei TaxID=1597 RepID=UPI001C45F742|nr:helix-turn-helix domain-containing protein [Lacticaseibacillus paracasei]QXJ68146.1 helix-turn-helix domain-containing protein [Lacticaseibacillus paracasei subsp. paracasei]
MNHIKEAREAKGISQGQLAKLLKTSQQSISFYESDKREPKRETWEKLSNILQVSIPYLMGQDGPEKYMDAGMEMLEKLKKEAPKGSYDELVFNYFDDRQSRALVLKALTALFSVKTWQGRDPRGTNGLKYQILDKFFAAYQQNVKSNQNLLRLVQNKLESLSETVQEYALIDETQFKMRNKEAGIIADLETTKVSTNIVDDLLSQLDKQIDKVEGMIKETQDGPDGLRLVMSSLRSEEAGGMIGSFERFATVTFDKKDLVQNRGSGKIKTTNKIFSIDDIKKMLAVWGTLYSEKHGLKH